MNYYVFVTSASTSSLPPLLDLTVFEKVNASHLTLASLPWTGRVTLGSMNSRLHAELFKKIFRLAAC